MGIFNRTCKTKKRALGFCAALTAAFICLGTAGGLSFGTVNAQTAAGGGNVFGVDTGIFRDTSDFKVTYNYDLAHSRFSPYAYYADGNELGAGYMEKYNGLFTKVNGYAYGNPVLLESKKSGSAANGARIELGTYKNTFSLIANPIQTNYVVDIGTYSTNQELNLSMPDENGVWGEPQRTVVTSYNQTIINGKSALNLFGRDNTPDNTKSTLNDLADFTEMTVVITDTVDPTNVLRIKMTEGNYDANGKLVNGSKMTFDYNGVTGDAAGEYTTDKDWSHLMGGLANSHTPFMFEFYASHANDKYTLKMGGLRAETYNLKNRAEPYPQGGTNGTNPGITDLTFNSRNEFSVAIEFGGITDGQTFDYYRSEMSEIKYDRKARLAVYSVNGQPLVGNPEEITEVSVSKADGTQLNKGIVGVPYKVPAYSQFSPLYGVEKYPAAYTSIVLKRVDCTPAQTITLNADNTFTPTAAGVYEVTYVCSVGYPKFRFKVAEAGSMLGASIKIIGDEGAIRFTVSAEKDLLNYLKDENGDLKSGVVTGILIIPTDLLGTNALVLGGDKVQDNVTGGKWIDGGNEFITSVYMRDIPAESFNREISARGYIKDGDKVYYTAPVSRSVSYVAARALEDGDFSDDAEKTLLQRFILDYAVTFKNAAGEVIFETTAKYGEKLTAPEGYETAVWANRAGTDTWDFENYTVTGKTVLYLKGE